MTTEETDIATELIARLRSRRQPAVFVISGPSGVGKDSIIEALRARFPDLYLTVTATTRAKRPGEIDGVHYHFLDEETFVHRIHEGEFLEHAIVYGKRYGVPRWGIREALDRGQDVIIKVDVQGARTMRQLIPDASFIFIAPESLASLLNRLRARKTDDPDALARRFSTAVHELTEAESFDYVVFNEDDRLDDAICDISSIITSHRRSLNATRLAV